MRLAIVQTQPVFADVTRNVKDALELMASVKADLYVLPELFNTGYNFLNQHEVGLLAESPSGSTFIAIRDWARQTRSIVAYGFAEQAQRPYNSAALVGPDGLIGLYRKVHLYYRETLYFSPGDLGFPVFDLPFGKVGMMVCFDWFYPESARALALNGAQLILHPSNLVMPYRPDAMITRCLENRVFAATANRVGTEDRGGEKFTYIGNSEIVSPGGEVLTRLGSITPGIEVLEVNLDLACDKRLNKFNDLFLGRRPMMYG